MRRIEGVGVVEMNFLLPPSAASLRRNALLLAAEWHAAGALARYFMASQLASATLLGLCALASMVAGLAGRPWLYVGLLGVAALCFVHTVVSWNVLKRTYKVRYEIW
jgi:hypothetical protein